MNYGNIVAIGHVDLRYLNQDGKIVIETPLAAASDLIAIGPGAAALLRPSPVVATRVIAIGAGALAVALAAGLDNIAIGAAVLGAATTGTRNVGIGTQALRTITIGNDNTAVGLNAMLGAAGSENAIQNVAVGAQALDAINAAVRDSTAVGYRAGTSVTAGIRNTLIGSECGAALTTGGYNTLIGFGTAPALTLGDRNVIIGSYAGGVTTMATLPAADSFGYIVVSANLDAAGGGPNIIVSDRLLRNLHFGVGRPGNWLNATGDDNLLMGGSAANVLTTGARNIAHGTQALQQLTTGNDNVAVGHNAQLGAAGSEAAVRNVAIGSFALDAISTAAADNVVAGYNAATAATGLSQSVVVGSNAFDAATGSTTARAVIIGYNAAGNAATAAPIDAVIIGYQAALATTTGNGGVFIGSGAGVANTTGPFNTLIGFGVAPNLTTGRNNVVIGAYEDTAVHARTSAADSTGQIVIAAEADTEAGARSSLVVVALQSVYVGSGLPGNWLTSTGLSNVGVGDGALAGLTSGTLNVVVGAAAGGGISSGGSNTLLGNNAGSTLTTGSRNILIGSGVGLPAVGTSDFLNLGKVLFADLSGKDVRIGGLETAAVAQTERLAVTDTNADTVAPFSLETTGGNGAKIFHFVGTQNPNGTVTGDPGDHYERKSGTSSTLFINTGAAAANTTWTALAGASTPVVQAQIPIETDDSADGYVIGSRVYSTAARSWYTAQDVTAGAAIWRRDTNPLRWPLSITPQVSNVATFVGFDGVAFGGTGSTPALATTNLHTSLRRMRGEDPFGGSVRGGPAMFWRGNAAALGGFYMRFVYSMSTTAAGQMSFAGLIAANPGLPFDTQTITDCFGVGNQAADANVNIIHNDNAGNVTAVDLGANFPAVSATAVYDVELYAAANDTNLYYVVHRRDTLFAAAGVVTTNMPATTTFLQPFFGASDMSGDTAGIDLMYMVGEIPAGHGDAAA